VADEFVFAGSVKDNAPYAKQKGRVDRRLIRTFRENFTMDGGEEVVLLDSKERGDLFEVRIVTDNPYVEVFIEIDEWRNDNASAAELLAQPDTGRLLSNFQAIDGGHPAIGYTLLYNPDIPEDYDGRIRVVVRNRIKANKAVFGSPGRYKSNGNLATPIELGFTGGFSMSVGGNIAALSMDDNPELVGFMMAGSPETPFLNNDGTSNPVFHSAEGDAIKPGALHPYVGIAGRPILSGDDLGNVAHANRNVHIFFDALTETPGFTSRPVWGDGSQMDIYIADFANTTALTTTLAANDRMYIHDNERIYFPGRISAVATNQSLPTKFAKNGAAAYTGCLKITCTPGLRLPPPSIIAKADSTTFLMGGTGQSFGSVTTPADSNPTIRVYRAEIKRFKRISYDG
jgi:hypothetical protein